MQLIVLNLLLAAIVTFNLSTSALGKIKSQAMPERKSYRLLGSGRRSTDTVWYAVSVEASPSTEKLKALICDVIRQEKPSHYGVVSILIFAGLDSYTPPIGHGDTDLDRQQDEHWLARYTWNRDISDTNYRLLLAKEGFVDFDHYRDCRQ